MIQRGGTSRSFRNRRKTMSKGMNRIAAAGLTICVALVAVACSPKVGSDAWCKKMEETPKGDWSANDAADYAKHCVLK